MTVQQVAKELVKAGFKKATTKRENFQTVFVGDYTARHLKAFGMNVIMVCPTNGMTCEKLQAAIPVKSEIKNGYVVIAA